MKSVQIQSFSGLYFPVFRLNTGKYGPEKTPYLDTFHVVYLGAITENNIIGTDHWYIILCIMPRYINQRETILFHFTQDTNKVRVEGRKTR